MKTIFLILVMALTVGTVYSVQPVRKPSIQIKIDGKSIKNGDILMVKPGQKLAVAVEMEGGRRDYCKFPETYSDLTGTAQILARSKDGLTYQLNGTKAEWKLLSEETKFTTDEFIVVKSEVNQATAELTVTNEKFAQSFVKIVLKATWQFSQGEKQTQEENIAESTIYFKTAGSSDVWFSSVNIQASGIRNIEVQEKLKAVQSACDSIENNFFRLNFSAVRQSIRNLQSSVNALKTTIDEVKTGNASYQTKIQFIGLPSDVPFKDIQILSTVIGSWATLETIVNDLKLRLGKLPVQSTKESNDELVKLIVSYNDWQNKLPENTFNLLPRYIPEIKVENLLLPENIHQVAEKKSITDYSLMLTDFNAFLDHRIEQVPNEIQRINSTQSRLQAVRLFDGMLMSYFSSINWAEWKNTRF